MRLEEAKRDHFRRLAKEEGYRSRAAYKLIQISNKYKLILNGFKVIDLGCAPGGWLQVASDLVGDRGMVVGVDIADVKRIGRKNIVIMRDDIHSTGFVSKLSTSCPNCPDSNLHIGGPLWIGRIQSQQFVQECRKISKLPLFEDELDRPTYYDISAIADQMQIRTPRITEVISGLNSIGRIASRTRLNPRALRTDASQVEIQSVLKELVR